MGYAKIDVLDYRIIWTDMSSSENTGYSDLDITKYMLTHSSEENLSIENSKCNLTLKLIKDNVLKDGTVAPFFASVIDGTSRLKTDSLLKIYMKYVEDNADPIISPSNLLKSYYVTNWNTQEPDNKLTISGVDLAYKITNRNSSKVYGDIYSETSGFTAVGTTFTDNSKTFPLGYSNKYQNGLINLTLELTDNAGNVYNYLITENTTTTCTTHKTIDVPDGSWAQYRIGWSAPTVLYDAIKRVVRNESGRGSIYDTVSVFYTTDLRTDYRRGIQLLRRLGSTTEAFPIVSIGEPYFPIYKLISEVSSYSACNTGTELELENPPIKRDMIFSVIWDDYLKQTIVDWFYADVPTVSSSILTILTITDNHITVDSPSASDIEQLARIKFTRSAKTYYKTYQVLNVIGSDYTLAPNPLDDGILAGDTIQIYGAVDFIWDNDEDFKHIYDFQFGSQDEEQFNHITFNTGTNEVGARDITGHWYNEQTTSDTLKETFIPMTQIAKGMMKFVTSGTNGVTRVIQKNDDVWEGWDGAAFTSTPSSWSFTTTFGISGGEIYTIGSRTDFNTYFKQAARARAQVIAKAIAIRQKENTLKGYMTVRGQKFITISSGTLNTKWYKKGTRILFRKKDSGLANTGNTYFNFIVTKLTHTIDKSRWTTKIEVEYDNYDVSELITAR